LNFNSKITVFRGDVFLLQRLEGGMIRSLRPFLPVQVCQRFV